MSKYVLMASALIITFSATSESRAVTCTFTADSNNAGKYTLNITGSAEDSVAYWYSCDNQLPSGYSDWESIKSKITSVTCDNNINTFNMDFSYADSLTSATMPNVTEIGDSTFYGTSSLKSIDVPMLAEIGDLAFGATGITYANIPSDVTYCVGPSDDRWCGSISDEYCGVFGDSPVCSGQSSGVSGNCMVENGKLTCGSCNGYTKSGTGCVTDCGEGYTAQDGACVKNTSCQADKFSVGGECLPKRYTPAELSKIVGESNTILLYYK